MKLVEMLGKGIWFLRSPKFNLIRYHPLPIHQQQQTSLMRNNKPFSSSFQR
jgi:hypothetical protein